MLLCDESIAGKFVFAGSVENAAESIHLRALLHVRVAAAEFEIERGVEVIRNVGKDGVFLVVGRYDGAAERRRQNGLRIGGIQRFVGLSESGRLVGKEAADLPVKSVAEQGVAGIRAEAQFLIELVHVLDLIALHQCWLAVHAPVYWRRGKKISVGKPGCKLALLSSCEKCRLNFP